MQEAHLTANNLACRRGERLLFTGLSLSLRPGEALQVSGPNGTGKSSLIRILAGLSRPFAGSVERTGSTGLLDERLAIDEHQPLESALDFWRSIDGSAPGDDADLLGRNLLGLNDLMDVPVRYLSTGQRKRAALARLMGQSAAIWMLDEPLNGLDVDAAALVERLAADHCAAGGIAVIASHQPFRLEGMERIKLQEFVP